MSPIVQKGDPVLRKKAKDVPEKLIGTPELKKIVSEMRTALSAEEDGVALAAPQIGIPFRIFVVAPKVFDMQSEMAADKAKAEKPIKKEKGGPDPLVYINPTITKISKSKRLMDEGCLSVRNYYGKVLRAEKATIEALDENGKKFTRGGSLLLAHIFQHETDHLNGILFIDRTEDLYYLPPEAKKRKK